MQKVSSILSLIIILFCSVSLKAQVDNYALKFSPEGHVSLGTINEINELSTYTVQFWMCPSSWTQGATILNRGNSFTIKLGVEGELIIVVGQESLSVKSSAFSVDKWVQVTLINDNDNWCIRINNEVVKTETKSYKIPTSSDNMMLGGSFSGRIDELRVWGTALSADYNYMWQNTLNQYHPQWQDLIAYYKFDQNLCPNIVDYTFRHHGSLSESGVSREIVSDNEAFRYFTVAAYTDFSRFSDRAIDREKYLLANTLIVLGINSYADGTASIAYPYNHGTISNGSYLAEFEGRKGVLALNGQGAKMEVGTNALSSTNGYTFHTWIYLDEWTEGAFIFKKEISDTKGFSIRLGQEESKQIIVRMDGREYIRDKKMSIGKWVHLGITTNNSQYPGELFMFTFNGVGSFPSRGNFPTEGGTYILSDLENVTAVVGENLHGKLDDTSIWKTAKDANRISLESNGLPMPGLSKVVEASVLHTMDSYWAYDKEDDLGYDSYSYKHFINIMRSAYNGHRGFKIKMSVSGHTGWESTFADARKRQSLGEAIARIANENDFDGVDLDFEWTYSDGGWLNYAKLVEIIRKNMNEGKLLTVTPHKVSYRFPKEYMKYVDYFLFQIYGPNDKNIFTKAGYEQAYNSFVQWGYPKDKIVMSYATTTSGGFDANGNLIKNGNATKFPPVGVRNLFDETYTPDMDRIYEASKDCYRYITGYDQVIWRNDFIRADGAKGIFYWDMGNDVQTTHKYSLPKGANFSLSANVDSLVTKVENMPPTPPTGITPIENILQSKKLNIYPNPTKNNISFDLPAEVRPKWIMIYDTAGQCVADRQLMTQTFSVEGLVKGTYSVLLYTTSGNVLKGMFIKI